jgi:pimeloyl-ACP methyl ester carboxylesterase
VSGTDAGSNETFHARLLSADRQGPALEFIELRPGEPSRGAPILLVHGAFGGAWMWSERFLPSIARSGRYIAAVSLRGHGGSEGRDRVREAALADYVVDLSRAFAEFADPPIVIAHSLGALLVQHLLGHERMRALILLAPVPPEGMFFLGPTLLITRPHIWFEAMHVLLGSCEPLRHVGQAIFSDRFSPMEINRYLSLMVPEGSRVLMEAYVPRPTLPAFLIGLPTLVISGSDDPVVGYHATLRTAIYHCADHWVIDGMGHLLHLEPGAEHLFQLVFNWIKQKGL